MTDLTSEQVLAQLQTRGFESGGFGSPLKHFRAKLTSITGSMVQRGTMPQARLEVSYNFDEVEVFESSEPYPFPIAQISLLHSNREKSGMGVLGHSMDAIINAGLDSNAPQAQAKNQDFLIGKIQEWKVTPGHMMWNRDDNKETPRDAWEVVYIEGVGGTPHSGAAPSQAATTIPATAAPAPPSVPTTAGLTPAQQALSVLDGKTQQEWHNTVLLDTLVKGDSALVSNIISGTFIPSMEEAGQVSKDADGIYHVKKD